ncbi:hypothetical protein BAE44_0011670 [Dichanthelium oligosanthes]|uniref:Uncharacterized protein n=1 Tax=Dichanthelium oligosanthes TaxID=888268 RepID=A0A1E5VQB1_9POAL|nr:hypothetical protein BAE44_0011670 [Dichanthelium oligosanthes]
MKPLRRGRSRWGKQRMDLGRTRSRVRRGGGCLGARLAALPADEELEFGGVYATFPMKRLGTPLAAANMGHLATAATREARRSARVSDLIVVPPATEVAAAVEVETPNRLRLDEMVDDAAAAELGVLKHRLSTARLRRPTLETIQEENYLLSRA